MKSFLLRLVFLNLLFISLNCSFQLSIFSELNKSNRGKNLIISPLSIFQILSLTANGARNKTQLEMIEALQNEDIDTLNAINYEILEAFQKFRTVEMANAVMSKFDPLEEFMDISEKYCAPFEKLISVKQVNNWCSEKTHGRITEILSKLEEEVQMILLNAVYFKGQWSSKFQERSTTKKIFYNLGNEIISVDMMNQISHFYYYQDDEIQAIELPYEQDGMTALIILPKRSVDINKYINSLNSEENSLSELKSKLKYSKVDLELPKFELKYDSSLKKILIDMGMEKAFTNNADFSGLSEDKKLKIDDVLHKTYLKVNEVGTEAAAVTAVIMRLGSARPMQEEIYSMKVNRPFLFLLRGKRLPEDYDLLFMSKIEAL